MIAQLLPMVLQILWKIFANCDILTARLPILLPELKKQKEVNSKPSKQSWVGITWVSGGSVRANVGTKDAL